MKHSFALVTGTTSGLGYAAAGLLAAKGYKQVIVTGRRLGAVQQTAAQLAAETKKNMFTPLELDLDSPSSVQAALAELVKRGQPIDFLLLNAGMVPGKKRVINCGGLRGFSGPADRPSSTGCRVAPRQPAEPQRTDRYRRGGTCPRRRTHVQVHRLASVRGQKPPW